MTEQKAIEVLNDMIIKIDIPKSAKIQINKNNALAMGIKALEKQIPKVPCYSGDGYYNGEMVIDTWECPCCGKQYEIDYDYHEYCPKCGQHIDHSTLTEDD